MAGTDEKKCDGTLYLSSKTSIIRGGYVGFSCTKAICVGYEGEPGALVGWILHKMLLENRKVALRGMLPRCPQKVSLAAKE